MRKQFVILEMTQLAGVPDHAGGEEAVELDALQEGAGGRIRINRNGEVDRVQAGLRPPPRERNRRERAAARAGLEEQRPDRYNRYYEVDLVRTYSMPEAEEYVAEALERNPTLKFIILESVAYMETVATPAIKKLWDANGQLREAV